MHDDGIWTSAKRRHQPPSLWEKGGQYLLAELRATLGILGLCAAVIFLLTCLLVGVYLAVLFLLPS